LLQVCIMKIRVIYILMMLTALGAGVTCFFQLTTPRRHAEKKVGGLRAQTTAAPKTEESNPRLDVRTAVPSLPKPSPEPANKGPAPTAPPKLAASKAKEYPGTTAVNNEAATLYWTEMAHQFRRQQEKLGQENDPEKRMNLIRTMARNVRADTLRTLDWAMNLEDPAERRAALEAINQNALSGIGARIEMDETGLPKLRETTVLSAIASTGLAEPGDYISGIVKGDGSTIYFKGRSLQQIVQLLRGKPGTEVRLLMERASADGNANPYSFDVPVQRSLIVVQPPF
jgi:C-terminal processing protease CtpA/Prc